MSLLDNTSKILIKEISNLIKKIIQDKSVKEIKIEWEIIDKDYPRTTLYPRILIKR